MFTKRSVVVGFSVLFLARLVSAAVAQGFPHPQSWYGLGDNFPKVARNQGLNTAIISNTGLANEFYWAAVESTEGDPLQVSVVSTDYLNAIGYLTNFAIDPANIWNTQVTTCELSDTPGTEFGYAADLVPTNAITSTRAVAAVTAPAAETVHFVLTPVSGEGPCVEVGSVSDTFTDTAYGVNVEVAGEDSFQYMIVNSWGSTTDPSGADGRVSIYSYDFNGATMNVDLVNHIDGIQLFDWVPVELATLCDVPAQGSCVFIAGRPWNTFDPPTVSSVGFITTTATILSNFEAPGESNLGQLVTVIGDVDSDNKPDVAIGSAGKVHVVSGADFGVPGGAVFTDTITVINGPEADGFPSSIGGGLDVNGDSIPDIAVGAMDADPRGKTDAGTVFLYNGLTGEEIYRIHGRLPGEELGGTKKGTFTLYDLAPYDNRSEYIIVAPFAETRFEMPGGIITHTGDIRFNASQPPVNLKNWRGLLDPFRAFRDKLGRASEPR
jgi:hypothetical protein